MSLQVAAQHLASKGRKGDTELVHMTKGEIKGLQELAMAHGGSLSINPDTGLVEASFLKRILPMVAGAALTGLSGGLINPFTASMIVGGFEGVRTGDLGKGLMAGLGAYGGAGLTSGIASAGTQAVGKTATDATIAANPQLTGGEIAREMGTAGFNAPTLATNANPATMTGFDKMSAGFSAGPKAIYSAAPTGTFPALATTAVAAATPEQKVPEIKEEPSSGKYISKDFQAYVPNTPNPYYRPQGLGYTGYAAEGGVMPDDLSYAVGGMVDPMQKMPNGGLATLQGMRDGYGAPQTMDGNMPQFSGGGRTLSPKEVEIKSGIFKDTNPNTANLGAAEAAEYYVRNAAKKNKVPYAKMPKTNMESLGNIEVGPVKQAAMGGSIGGYSDGGRMLKGPGDGMSDSIPGIIGKRQPARLADGEFVVPADVVSHLGNGSTDAGAKRLYAMMDKVRHARTGNKKQGKKIKPEKYMPA
jgi:hypothetical protein